MDDARLITMLELLKSSYWYTRELKDLLKAFDISHEQFNILKILEHNQNRKFSLKEIQSRVMNKTENTTRLVEKLRQKGYIKSELSKRNRRTLEIQIEKKGLELLTQTKAAFSVLGKRLDKVITKKDADHLVRILRHLRMA